MYCKALQAYKSHNPLQALDMLCQATLLQVCCKLATSLLQACDKHAASCFVSANFCLYFKDMHCTSTENGILQSILFKFLLLNQVFYFYGMPIRSTCGYGIYKMLKNILSNVSELSSLNSNILQFVISPSILNSLFNEKPKFYSPHRIFTQF